MGQVGRSKYIRTRQEATTRVKERLKPGDTVYCVLKHRSQSGVLRRIQLLIVDKKTKSIEDISYWVAHAIKYHISKVDGALVVRGCGMDMGFHVVYSLGRVLFPRGGSINKSQRRFMLKRRETDGGYLLRHVWL